MSEHISELTQAVKEVFQTMVFMEITAGPAPESINWTPEKLYTSVVGFGGEETGLIYIHCNEDFAKKVTGCMLGMDVGDDNGSIIDAMGEIANMVGGNFKSKVPQFVDLKLSLPSVIVGKDYRTHVPGGQTGNLQTFLAGEHSFLVQMVLKK